MWCNDYSKYYVDEYSSTRCDSMATHLRSSYDQSENSLPQRHEILYCAVQSICVVACFYGVDFWRYFLLLQQSTMSQFLRTFSSTSIFLPPTLQADFSKLLSIGEGTFNEAVEHLTTEEIEIASGGQDLGDGFRNNTKTDAVITSLDYLHPFDPCLLVETSASIVSGYQYEYDNIRDKFDVLNRVPPTRLCSVVDHSECDDKSEGTSPTNCSGTMQTSEDETFSDIVASKSVLPITGSEEDSKISGSSIDTAPSATSALKFGFIVPPLHPTQVEATVSASDNLSNGWTPATTSRRQRRRRKIEGPSFPSTTGIAISTKHSSIDPTSPLTGVTKGSSLFRTFATGQNSSEMMGGSSGASIVPSFEKFGVTGGAKQGKSQPTKSPDRYSVPKPALNDFQKRSREYSVGSVGSW